MEKFWDWIDNRAIVHRLVLGITVYMTVHCYLWGIEFAKNSNRSGADISLIIIAVSGPITALQGFAFTTYANYRKKDI